MKTSLLFALALALVPRLTRAADVLEIPEQCGSHTELQREVSALQASALSAPNVARPDVRMRRDGDVYLLEVELPEGRRSLRDPDCRALFRAAIVIAALGHESSANSVLAAAQAKPEPAREAQTAEASATPPARAPKEEARSEPVGRETAEGAARVRVADDVTFPSRLSLRALLRADLAYGVVPEVSALIGAGIALEYARFSLRTVFAYHTPRSADSGEEGVRIYALSGSLTLELVALPWLRPGVGVDFDALHGRGSGGQAPSSDWATQVTLHGGLSLRMLQRGPFWLELEARGLWAPEPARFLMVGRHPVYSASAWGVQAGIAASYQFL